MYLQLITALESSVDRRPLFFIDLDSPLIAVAVRKWQDMPYQTDAEVLVVVGHMKSIAKRTNQVRHSIGIMVHFILIQLNPK